MVPWTELGVETVISDMPCVLMGEMFNAPSALKIYRYL